MMPAAPVPDARRTDAAAAPAVATAANHPGEIDLLWLEYFAGRDAAIRRRLVDHYMRSLVRRIAQYVHSSLPRQVDMDDLIQEGYFGLVDTLERFDPRRHVRFDTFASPRIAGMMRDFLRRTDPVPRLERWRQRQLAAAQDEFFKRHGRPPADGELACTGAAEAGPAAGPQGGEFRRFFQAREIAHDSPDRFHGGPLSSTEREDLKEWVTTGFSRTDRLIIILYYYEHLTMKEIGRTIGCSESRVSQRLVLILKALRARLERTGRAGELET